MLRIKKNKIIRISRKVYYQLYEPLRLRIERYLHRCDYHELNPLISIYTPTYNRGLILLDRAVKSVLNQTYKNIEYVIVSDGSTDNTESLVNSVKFLSSLHIRFYKIKRKSAHHNYNSVKAWNIEGTNAANYALKKCRGKYIARLDDDDIWEDNYLETMLRNIQKGNLEYITSAFDFVSEGKLTVDSGVPINEYLRTKSKNCTKVGAHSTWFYRSYLKFMKYNRDCWRKSWNKVADTDLMCRFLKSGIRMGFVDKVLIHQIPRPNETKVGFKAIQDNIEKYTMNACSYGQNMDLFRKLEKGELKNG